MKFVSNSVSRAEKLDLNSALRNILLLLTADRITGIVIATGVARVFYSPRRRRRGKPHTRRDNADFGSRFGAGWGQDGVAVQCINITIQVVTLLLLISRTKCLAYWITLYYFSNARRVGSLKLPTRPLSKINAHNFPPKTLGLCITSRIVSPCKL